MSDKNEVRDPVCIMNVESGKLSFFHEGIEYSFCSQQCQDRFSTNPHLYIGKPGKPSPKQHGQSIIKRRILKLDDLVPDDVANKINSELRKMMGVKAVTIDHNIIRITYDLLEATAEQIEMTIEASGKYLQGDWQGKIKRAFIHYLEESELDNLELQSSSHSHH